MLDRVVTLYTTAGCHRCEEARALLRRKGIEFADVEVKGNEAAIKELMRLTGATIVPTLVVGDDVQVGWDPGRVEEMLDDPLPIGTEELTAVLEAAEVALLPLEEDEEEAAPGSSGEQARERSGSEPRDPEVEEDVSG